jgi:glutamyl-tRNA reductase
MYNDVDYNVVTQKVIIDKDDTSLIITPERPLKNVVILYTCAQTEIVIRINDTDMIKSYNYMFDFSHTNLIVKKIEFILPVRSGDTEIYIQGIN